MTGTLINGLKARSKRVALPPSPSSASWWNRALEPLPRKVLFVVHGTTLLPPACTEDQPAGSVPGATPLKSSLYMVVAEGVPVVRSKFRSLVAPLDLVKCNVRLMRVPGAKPAEICSTKLERFVAVAPAAIGLGYAELPLRTVTPAVLVVRVALTLLSLPEFRGFVT